MEDIRGVRLRKFNLRKIILGVRMHFHHTGTEGDWIICWRNCVRRALWNGRLVAAGDVHRVTSMLFKTCVEKHRTSFLQTCGLQTVQTSIQLTTWSGLSCITVYTRQKSTPSKNWSSGWLKSGAALNSRLSTWLLISGIEDFELVCVRKEDTSNITFELTDCVDFVNNLSPYVLFCLNVALLSKTTLL